MKRKLLIVFSLLLLAFGCNDYVIPELKDGVDGQDGRDGIDGFNVAWDYVTFESSDDYPYGGIKVVFGLDINRNGQLDDGEWDTNQPGLVAVHGTDGNDAENPVLTIEDCILYNGDVALGNVCGLPGVDGVNGIDGVDGITRIAWPFVTEIPGTEDHTNGGWMYTWYEVDENLQILGEDSFIGTYPVWNGNDGSTPWYNEETNTWWVDNYNTNVIVKYELTISENNTWVINGEDTGKPVNGEDGKPGIPGVDGVDGEDGKSPYVGEDGYWYFWNGETWEITVKAQGETGPAGPTGAPGTPGVPGLAGEDGEDGADGTVVDFVVEEVSSEECESGGFKVTIYLDGVDDDYFFIVCNGLPGEEGPEGSCDCEDDDGDEGCGGSWNNGNGSGSNGDAPWWD